MKRWIALAAALAALAACTTPGEARRQRLRPTANPSAVVATELAFARMAQEQGQWAAFRRFAADDALMFTPQPTQAKAWLKGRAEPPVAVKWQPYSVWMSCDGSLAVTKGAWQRPNGVGYFTTVWQRQRNGSYKWVLDQGDALKEPLPAPEMIAATVADCTSVIEEVADMDDDPNGTGAFNGKSDDGSLEWSIDLERDGSRLLTVDLRKDGHKAEVLRSEVAAE